MRLATRLTAIVLLLFAASASAADYCVDTGAEFVAALTASAASDEDDLIKVSGTSFTLPAGNVTNTFKGNLVIRGGYSAACLILLTSSSTTINGPGATSVTFNLRDADFTLARVGFANFTIVSINDGQFNSVVKTGSILVQRALFDGNVTGLRIISDHHDVRVENSIFRDSTATDGNIVSGSGLSLARNSDSSAVVIAVQLVNNTVVGNRIGITLDTNGDVNFVPVIANTIAYGNDGSDVILRLPALISYSLWVNQDFGFGGGLAGGSGNNLAVDPQLTAGLQPITPNSPVINSGDNTPAGGLPSSDYDGGARLIGTKVDRGAYESNVNDKPILTVTSTANSGAGTLRQAILDANTSPDEKTIAFAIVGVCPLVINVSSALPAVTAPVTIDGYTQTGSAENDATRAFNGTLCVALNGGDTIGNGLHLQTGAGESMTVKGIAFYGFTSEAVLISGTGIGNVRGNGFGVGAVGLIAAGFDDAAIRVQGATGSVIGGRDDADRNVISRATQVGVRLETSAGGRTVQNNLIGFNLAGTTAQANGIGIAVEGSVDDSIVDNIIGFSDTIGVRITASATPAQSVTISDNDLGISATFGNAGNGTNAVRVEGGEEHALLFNEVRNNGTDGLVVLTTARRTSMKNNSISNNGLQAIDMSPNGVNPIDLDVGATGANDGQNYPTLTNATGTSDDGTVSGNLQSENGTYLIQFFRTAACDADGFGEAGGWIGQTSVVISNAGAANGSVAFNGSVIAPSATLFGRAITAIATDEEGNSSEVSACVEYPLFADGFE